MRSAALLAALASCLAACPRSEPAASAVAPLAVPDAAGEPPLACSERAPAEPLQPCGAGAGTVLQRAITHYDARRYSEALACAVQACAHDPESADAHAERAAALAAVGRVEDARLAFARALSIDPDHADALLGAADLYLGGVGAGREHSELALSYARRGRASAQRANDGKLAAEFALLQATALNNLGRSAEALERAQEAMTAGVDPKLAQFERASALYELCRFDEARRDFEHLLDDSERRAWAHRHLGLIAERSGDPERAKRELAAARQLSPEDFPPEIEVSRAEFAQLVQKAVQALPADMREDLIGVEVVTAELPDLEDLVAEEPPLSPSIIGLFRGPPLAEPCPEKQDWAGACRTIVFYRKNLARTCRSRTEFEHQLYVTLVHEIGHLRGEDDLELAARGLE